MLPILTPFVLGLDVFTEGSRCSSLTCLNITFACPAYRYRSGVCRYTGQDVPSLLLCCVCHGPIFLSEARTAQLDEKGSLVKV